MIHKVGTFVRTLAEVQQYPSSYKLHGFSADGCIAYVGASDDKTLIPMEASSIYPSNWNSIKSLDKLRVDEGVTLADGRTGILRQIVFSAEYYDETLAAVEVDGTTQYRLFKSLSKLEKSVAGLYQQRAGTISLGDYVYLSRHGVSRSGLKYDVSQANPCKVVSILNMANGKYITQTPNARAALLLVTFYDTEGHEVASDVITGDCVTNDVDERAYINMEEDDERILKEKGAEHEFKVGDTVLVPVTIVETGITSFACTTLGANRVWHKFEDARPWLPKPVSPEQKKGFSNGDPVWVRGTVEVIGENRFVMVYGSRVTCNFLLDVKHQ